MKPLRRDAKDAIVLEEVTRAEMDESVRGEAWLAGNSVAAQEFSDPVKFRWVVRLAIRRRFVDIKRTQGAFNRSGGKKANRATIQPGVNLSLLAHKRSEFTEERSMLDELRRHWPDIPPLAREVLITYVQSRDRKTASRTGGCTARAAKSLGREVSNLRWWMQAIRDCLNGKRQWHDLNINPPKPNPAPGPSA